MKKTAFFLFLFFIFSSSFSQVVLNEVMFDPSGQETAEEFVELYNSSGRDTVLLSGWRLGDESGDDRIVDAGKGLFLPPHRYAVVLDPDYFTQSATYDSLIPKDALILTVEGSTLGNAGLSNSRPETVLLMNGRGETVARYTYTTGNRPGCSDEKIDCYGSDESSNWADSKTVPGTPGMKNSVCETATREVALLHVHPDPFSPDSDDFEDRLTVFFRLPWPEGAVSLRIFDIRGRTVRNLIPGMECAGEGLVDWDGKDDTGKSMRTGIYIIVLEGLCGTTGESIQKKCTAVLASPL
jgi:hypothetical protein